MKGLPIKFKLPDIDREYNCERDYLLELLERAELSQREAAKRLGINERTMRDHVAPAGKRRSRSPVPYTIQYSLECIVAMKEAGFSV